MADETKTLHIWMLDGRSLCDRRAHPAHQGKSDKELERARQEAEAAPACGPCLLLASTIRREAAALLDQRPTVYPDKASEVWASLRGTRWANYFHLNELDREAERIDEGTKYDQITRAVDEGSVRQIVARWDEEIAKHDVLRDQVGGKGPASVL